MDTNCNHKGIQLERNGTDQLQRFLKMLDPANTALVDISTADWMDFAFQFAQYIKYFDTHLNTPITHWQDFFIRKDDIQETLDALEKDEDLTPHLALFVCFLELITLSQERFNQITKRHLDFYYKEVLRLDNKAPVADQAHIIFELAKNAIAVKVDEETALEGGKDALGKKRNYHTLEEFIPNQAKVASLRSVYHDKVNQAIKYAPVANSYDGFGEDFPDDDIKWWPFGHPLNKASFPGQPEQPKAKLGFAVASPILKLKEGTRTIAFTFKLSGGSSTSNFAKASLPNALEVLLSGEREWIPAALQLDQCTVSKTSLKIVVAIGEGSDAIVPYDPEVLLENFTTISPVARFLFKNEDDNSGYSLHQFLVKRKVTEVDIAVKVEGIQEVIVESDLGRMDASKPFMPFGPQPIEGSNLYIGHEEALAKNWDDITLNLKWKDTPENFRDHYLGYRNRHLNNLGKNTYTLDTNNYTEPSHDNGLIIDGDSYFKVDIDTLEDRDWTSRETNETLFVNIPGSGFFSTFQLTSGANSSSSTTTTYYGTFNKKVDVPQVKSDIEKVLGYKVNQNYIVVDNIVSSIGTTSAPNFSASSKQGFIRLTLKQSFLHELFPKIYAVAMAKQDHSEFESGSWVTKSAYIPQEPYTPLIESVQMTYSASTTKKLDIATSNPKTALSDYLDESVEFFHEHPYGQSEEHRYLKGLFDFSANDYCTLVPQYDHGTLYIGLENAGAMQQVALLVQVLEGSENPTLSETETYTDDEQLQWHILTNNLWKPLDKDFIISNNTDNFLRSGIVKVSIPKEANSDNTLLPKGFHWLRVTHTRPFDAVSQVRDIMAQVVLSAFSDNDNELSHLEKGLPAETISKMVSRLAQVKRISQPFNSFNGTPKESDQDFYRRISERLRHKQRAITIWDYERLILQEFKYLYKVNCLKHTKDDDFLAPGEVALVVVPNVVNQNIYDSYQPSISKAKRNEIETFTNKLNTLHVEALVENPDYREVKVSLEVRFYEGKDENFYKKQLQLDISKFLAPWAFEETAAINFGGTLHKSTMIHYIEKLDYVDYLKNLTLKVQMKAADGTLEFKYMDKVISETPRVILTSAKPELHDITVIQEVECTIA